jgi:ABC-2 type transport system permease protein
MTPQPSFFRQLKGFFIGTLKGTFRSFSAIFFGLLFPIVFVSAFGFSGGSGDFALDIGVVNSENSSVTTLKKSFETNKSFRVKTGSFDELKSKFNEGNLDVILEGNSINSSELNLYVNKKRPSTAGIAAQTISTILDKQTLAQNNLKPAVSIVSKELESNTFRYIDFVLPGLIGFSLLSGAIQGLAFTFLTMKKRDCLPLLLLFLHL